MGESLGPESADKSEEAWRRAFADAVCVNNAKGLEVGL